LAGGCIGGGGGSGNVLGLLGSVKSRVPKDHNSEMFDQAWLLCDDRGVLREGEEAALFSSQRVGLDRDGHGS
jgi:hypothetical protein